MVNVAGFIMMCERRRITESQSVLGWKGHSEVIWSNPPTQVGTPKEYMVDKVTGKSFI